MGAKRAKKRIFHCSVHYFFILKKKKIQKKLFIFYFYFFQNEKKMDRTMKKCVFWPVLRPFLVHFWPKFFKLKKKQHLFKMKQNGHKILKMCFWPAFGPFYS